MGWEAALSLLLTASALLSLALTRIGPHLVMMGVLTVLSVTGILTADEALAGFSNSGLITVVALFVVAAGIHASGGIDLLVNGLLGHPRSVRMAQARVVAPIVALSAVLNNTPVVATMIPALHAWSKRIGVSPSKLFIPLSYAAILGGTLTMIGTSTNLVVNGLYQKMTGEPELGIFSITLIGLPVAVFGSLFMLWVFPRLLPTRSDEDVFGNMREFTLEVAVAHNGPLVGKSIRDAGLRNLKRIYLVEIDRDGTILTAVPTEERLRGGDRLVFAGDTEAISDLLRINGIVPSSADTHVPLIDNSREERRLVEAVISPHSDCIGETIRDSRFRDRYGAAVLAVARNGERVQGNLGSIRLEAGDTLLLEARPAFVTRQRFNKDFLLINDLDTETPRHDRAWLAWGILVAVVGLAATGVTSMLNAALLGAAAVIVTGCTSVNGALKSIDLQVVITIGASFALGVALQKTGVAALIAGQVLSLGGGNPILLLVIVYLLVSLLTEIITNNAAALIMLPIALSTSSAAGVDPEPFAFAVMMAASASFATPLGYQTNLMVYGPGDYRFGDFLRAGIPMNLLVAVVSLVTISLLYFT